MISPRISLFRDMIADQGRMGDLGPLSSNDATTH